MMVSTARPGTTMRASGSVSKAPCFAFACPAPATAFLLLHTTGIPIASLKKSEVEAFIRVSCCQHLQGCLQFDWGVHD
jgi:hypothetical protein